MDVVVPRPSVSALSVDACSGDTAFEMLAFCVRAGGNTSPLEVTSDDRSSSRYHRDIKSDIRALCAFYVACSSMESRAAPYDATITTTSKTPTTARVVDQVALSVGGDP